MANDRTTARIRAFVDAVWTSDLDALDRLVALAYADHADFKADDGADRVWVVQGRLAERTGMSERRVRTAVKTLVERGYLRESQAARQHFAARYALTVPRPAHGAALTDTGAALTDPRPAPRAALPPVDNSARPAHGAARPAPRSTRPAPRAADYNSTPRFHTTGGATIPDDVVRALRSAGARDEHVAAAYAHACADPETTWPDTRIVRDPRFARAVVAAERAARERRRDELDDCPVHGEPGKVGVCSGCNADHKVGEHHDAPSAVCSLCRAEHAEEAA